MRRPRPIQVRRRTARRVAGSASVQAASPTRPDPIDRDPLPDVPGPGHAVAAGANPVQATVRRGGRAEAAINGEERRAAREANGPAGSDPAGSDRRRAAARIGQAPRPVGAGRSISIGRAIPARPARTAGEAGRRGSPAVPGRAPEPTGLRSPEPAILGPPRPAAIRPPGPTALRPTSRPPAWRPPSHRPPSASCGPSPAVRRPSPGPRSARAVGRSARRACDSPIPGSAPAAANGRPARRGRGARCRPPPGRGGIRRAATRHSAARRPPATPGTGASRPACHEPAHPDHRG